MTLTIKLDGNWGSFQPANSAPPLCVTGSAIAPSARIVLQQAEASRAETQINLAGEDVHPQKFKSQPADNTISKNLKANSTLRTSQAVPHPSTDRALHRLTSEFGWDRVYSMQYGRWRQLWCVDQLHHEITMHSKQTRQVETSPDKFIDCRPEGH